jgi:predicted AAA+ superfamily ATPase
VEYNKNVENIMENKMIKHSIFDEINSILHCGKIILIFGTRRVKKTTLIQQLIEKK